MDINRLNEFITLATLLNYSKAANKLYLTQPALSRHIHDLENTLGAPLFIRDTHSVHLTSIGEIFFDEAKAIVERYEHALLLVKEAANNTTGELKLGFLGTASQNFLSDFVSSFTASHPDIRLSMNCGILDTLIGQLDNEETDVCIVTYIDKDYRTGLESELISTFRLCAILHPNHPLAKCETLSISDLSGFPFINFSMTEAPLASEFNRQLFKKIGAKCNTVEEINYVEEGIFMASINRGFFIVPIYLLHLVPKSMVVKPLADEHCEISLNLLWKKSNTNPSLPVFVNEYHVYMKNHYTKAGL